jgi:hypothetical protein
LRLDYSCEVRLILQKFIPGDTTRDLIRSGEAQKIHPVVRMELKACCIPQPP